MTHYLPLGAALYAVCGAAISRREHANEPECATCRMELAALNVQTGEERFGGPEIADPPAPLPFPKIGGGHAGR